MAAIDRTVAEERLRACQDQAIFIAMYLSPAVDPADFPPDLVDLARTLFEDWRRADCDGTGVTRETFGPAETRVMQHVEAIARGAGLESAWDAAGNLCVTLPGTMPTLPAGACGSHVDSVPQGGAFDGTAGVIAGLMALLSVARGPRPSRSLHLFVLRGEESAWYGRPYLGSSALFGQFDASWMDLPNLRDASFTLGHAMAREGADITQLAAQAKQLDPSALSHFVELHIEQGPVMVARGVPIGLVSGIRGNHRHPSARAVGEAAHSGAVPRWLRRDAVLGAADFAMRLDTTWRTILERGEDLVMTFGIFATDAREHAMTRVPSEVRFTLEYRSESMATLDAFLAIAEAEAADVTRERRVWIELGPGVRTPPATMDARLLSLARKLCTNAKVPHEVLASGAGHDAAIFANAGVPSAMVFVRNENGSHNPREAMEFDDFLIGAALLRSLLLQGGEAIG